MDLGAPLMAIDLGHDTVITARLVRTRAWRSWVAEIQGLHPKYELKREFLPGVPPQHPDHHPNAASWHIPHPGLYEYRNFGDGNRHGFFIVTNGFLRRNVTLISTEEAHERATRMAPNRRRR
ncbi:hypothetical protein [Streptomyces sp. NPDC056682]|uniref:hypothetical protein n=1 Tax=Streptomyces sp. NPDC056682 TaxID=3345909 RepID=UPI003675588C